MVGDRVEMMKPWYILEKGHCFLCSGRTTRKLDENPDEKDIE